MANTDKPNAAQTLFVQSMAQSEVENLTEEFCSNHIFDMDDPQSRAVYYAITGALAGIQITQEDAKECLGEAEMNLQTDKFYEMEHTLIIGGFTKEQVKDFVNWSHGYNK